jgi:hypothetical protein
MCPWPDRQEAGGGKLSLQGHRAGVHSLRLTDEGRARLRGHPEGSYHRRRAWFGDQRDIEYRQLEAGSFRPTA